ncbi:ABC transporter permease [Caloranaerobacter ferrireducens]|uniref:ABC transporter permease n=1 Tax=Caloranaerobacter ferrireducens TaxID=1323370 RepID=UPI00084DFA43|nr:ABC transporter permease [Caloranaerobacter ferrireducens]
MRRILSIFKRDISNSLRDSILVYMLIAPILLTIGFKFFIPSAQSASLQFAIDERVGKEVIEVFDKYGKVEVYSSVEDIKERVKNIDDITGITLGKDGGYQLILEGNETHDSVEISKMIIRSLLVNRKSNLNYIISDIGTKTSPLATYGTIFLLLMAILVSGVIIGFNIIEEKESNTLMALNVTPMKKIEFIIGKSITGIILPVIQAYIMLWILGWLNSINNLMVFVLIITSSLIGIITGFLIGVISSNQMVGMTNMKIINFLISLIIIGAILLPKDKQFFLYWAPPYWFYTGFKGILLNTITWAKLGIYVAWIIGTVSFIFGLLKNKIRKGLV